MAAIPEFPDFYQRGLQDEGENRYKGKLRRDVVELNSPPDVSTRKSKKRVKRKSLRPPGTGESGRYQGKPAYKGTQTEHTLLQAPDEVIGWGDMDGNTTWDAGASGYIQRVIVASDDNVESIYGYLPSVVATAIKRGVVTLEDALMPIVVRKIMSVLHAHLEAKSNRDRASIDMSDDLKVYFGGANVDAIVAILRRGGIDVTKIPLSPKDKLYELGEHLYELFDDYIQKVAKRVREYAFE